MSQECKDWSANLIEAAASHLPCLRAHNDPTKTLDKYNLPECMVCDQAIEAHLTDQVIRLNCGHRAHGECDRLWRKVSSWKGEPLKCLVDTCQHLVESTIDDKPKLMELQGPHRNKQMADIVKKIENKMYKSTVEASARDAKALARRPDWPALAPLNETHSSELARPTRNCSALFASRAHSSNEAEPEQTTECRMKNEHMNSTSVAATANESRRVDLPSPSSTRGRARSEEDDFLSNWFQKIHDYLYGEADESAYRDRESGSDCTAPDETSDYPTASQTGNPEHAIAGPHSASPRGNYSDVLAPASFTRTSDRPNARRSTKVVKSTPGSHDASMSPQIGQLTSHERVPDSSAHTRPPQANDPRGLSCA